MNVVQTIRSSGMELSPTSRLSRLSKCKAEWDKLPTSAFSLLSSRLPLASPLVTTAALAFALQATIKYSYLRTAVRSHKTASTAFIRFI